MFFRIGRLQDSSDSSESDVVEVVKKKSNSLESSIGDILALFKEKSLLDANGKEIIINDYSISFFERLVVDFKNNATQIQEFSKISVFSILFKAYCAATFSIPLLQAAIRCDYFPAKIPKSVKIAIFENQISDSQGQESLNTNDNSDPLGVEVGKPGEIDDALYLEYISEIAKNALLSQNEKHALGESTLDCDTYFYDHLPLGEQACYGWDKERERLFDERSKQLNVTFDKWNIKWGLFSLGIPGKTGLDCLVKFHAMTKEKSKKEKHKIELQKQQKNTYEQIDNYMRMQESLFQQRKAIEAHNERLNKEIQRARIVSFDGFASSITYPQRKRPQVVIDEFIEQKPDLPLIFKWNDKRRRMKPLAKRDIPSADLSQLHALKSLQFVCKDTTVTLPSEANVGINEVKDRNPLRNLIDPISNQQIMVPTIAPDGTLLDYSTWMKSIRKNRLNPVTNTPITKHQLRFITPENYDSLVGEITNFKL